ASAKATRRGGRPRKGAKGTKGVKGPKAAKAPAPAKPAPKAVAAPVLTVGAPGKGGAVTVRFEGSGLPDDLAAFFLSLGRTS
ncbi:MAG: hypothetical protein DYH06_03555, partial [Acidobacteria bacterium ACB2]|nr:hypothetical protein [Acidobacteria bacterium ACB2]